jgi:hypothetical protein
VSTELEALKWHRRSKNRSALATNWFQGTANAIRFVEALYEAGARNVEISNIFEDDPGGQYADSLEVTLPEAREARERVLTVIAVTGGQTFEDAGQGSVGLWWD